MWIPIGQIQHKLPNGFENPTVIWSELVKSRSYFWCHTAQNSGQKRLIVADTNSCRTLKTSELVEFLIEPTVLDDSPLEETITEVDFDFNVQPIELAPPLELASITNEQETFDLLGNHSLAKLAFMGAGSTHRGGEYQKQLLKSARWMVKQHRGLFVHDWPPSDSIHDRRRIAVSSIHGLAPQHA